jgi:hypothetical protein
MEALNDRRHAEMVKSLSEAVDSLINAIESGRVGFDYAVKEYADQSDNELARTFKEFAKEMKLGDSQPIYSDDEIPDLIDERREALLKVAERINVPEVTTFAKAMIEAQDQDISVVKALQGQAEHLRQELPPA